MFDETKDQATDVEQRLLENSKSRVYQSIQAPDSLLQKVLERTAAQEQASLQKNPATQKTADLRKITASATPHTGSSKARILQFLTPLAGVAACLCVLIAMSVASVNHFDKAAVTINGTLLGSAPVCINTDNEPAPIAAFAARFREVLELPLEIDSARPVTVSVSDGTLQLYSEGTSFPEEGSTVTKQETDSLTWLLDDLGEDRTAVLTITINGRRTDYTVTMNESDGLWYMEQSIN